MLAQLPLELIDRVIECLSFDDVRAIACVCSALRPPAQLRLFKTISIWGLADTDPITPSRTEILLSQPSLLRCASHLIVEDLQFPFILHQREISIHSLWPHLPTMYRLTYVELDLEPSTYAIGLSALEALGSAREIELNLRTTVPIDLIISDKPLPVHSLTMPVDTAGDQLTTQLLRKCSQTLRVLRLFLQMNRVPSLAPLPYLCELSLHMCIEGSDPDLVSWFSFLDQHPTITCLSIDSRFILLVPPLPNMLPNLHSLKATTLVIERLIPGRPIHSVHAIYYSYPSPPFPVNTMCQIFQLSNVPLTVLEITTYSIFPGEGLIKVLKSLPKLREFTLDKPRYEVCP